MNDNGAQKARSAIAGINDRERKRAGRISSGTDCRIVRGNWHPVKTCIFGNAPKLLREPKAFTVLFEAPVSIHRLLAFLSSEARVMCGLLRDDAGTALSGNDLKEREKIPVRERFAVWREPARLHDRCGLGTAPSCDPRQSERCDESGAISALHARDENASARANPSRHESRSRERLVRVRARHRRAVVKKTRSSDDDAWVETRGRLEFIGAQDEHIETCVGDGSAEARRASNEESGSDLVAVELHDITLAESDHPR